MPFSPLKPSITSINPKSLKRNISPQIVTPQLPEIQKYDTNKLLEEFKRSLLREDKKQLNKHSLLKNDYKNFISDIKKGKEQKKKQLQKLSTKLNNVIHIKAHSSINLFKDIQNYQFDTPINFEEPIMPLKQYFPSCKFKPIRPMTSETKFRINQGKSRMIVNQSVEGRFSQQVNSIMAIQNSKMTKISQNQIESNDHLSNTVQKSLPEISESILMVQVQQSKLQGEIFSLKQSLNKLKKQVESVKNQLQIQTRNQEKYKHISYLANSIKNQTEYIRQQNSKGFNTMAQRQDETLSHLKKFKTNLRKEKDDIETEYIQDINHWVQTQEESNAAKKREFIFSATNTPRKSEDLKSRQDLKSPDKKFQLLSKAFSFVTKSKSSSMMAKSMKKLIDQLDTIVDLLQKNEPTFGEIKERQCTKVRLGKINKSLLSKQKVQILQKIQEFEEKYDMKIGSVENLILSVYHALFNSNKTLETQCLNLTHTKEQLAKDLKQILQKHQASIDTFEGQFKMMASEETEQRKKNQILKKNSAIFLRIIEVFYTMLFKFRYMFSLALTLDIDKKSFRDCVIQIDSCFSCGLLFNFSYEKHLITSSQRHDIINEKEFKEMILDRGLNCQLANSMTQTLFNDHRINLILHKSWIENKLKSLKQRKITQGDILDIIEAVKNDCQNIYKMRLPALARLFMTCFKSVSMTKYESKLAASSNQRESIFLPTGKHKKFHYLQMVDENNDSYDKDSQMSSYEPSKKKITFKTENEHSKDEHVFEKDPSKIIYHLQQIKNKNHKKFKALNFTCQGKTYKYNEQIVIPDFSMICRENDF